jgi:hypothetical protein
MAGGLGILGYFGLAPESSGGVAVAQPTAYFQITEESISGEFDRYELFNIIGQLAPIDDRAGVMRVEGDITLPFHPLLGGHIAKCVFGSATVSTTGAAAGMYRHSWKTPTVSQWDNRFALPPYTFEVFRDVGSAQQYSGVQGNELEFTLQPNGVFQARIGVIAQTWTNKAATTASYRSDIDVFDFDTASFSIDGAANPNIEAFQVTFNNNLEGIPTLSLRDTVYKTRRSAPPEIMISLTMGFEDIVELSKFRSQSETTMSVNLTSASYTATLSFPRVIYTSMPLGMGGGGRQLLEIEGMARYSQGSGTAFELALVSAVGSY